MSKINWNRISIRKPIMDDAQLMVKYWIEPSEVFRKNREAVNQSAFPKRDEFLQKICNQIETGAAAKYQRIAVFDGEAIGMFNLNNVTEEFADFHTHIWDVGCVGKGIGHIAGALSLKFFFDEFKFKKIYLKPPKNMPFSLNAVKKLGLKKVREEVFESPMVKEGTVVEVYEVFLEQLESYIDKHSVCDTK